MLDCFIAKGGRKRTANARKAAKKETLALIWREWDSNLLLIFGRFSVVADFCKVVVSLYILRSHTIRFVAVRVSSCRSTSAELSQYECRVVAVRFRFVAVQGESCLDSLSAAVLGIELTSMSLSNLAKVPC